MQCDYVSDVVRIGRRLGLPAGSLSVVEVQHDPWCPFVGGDGEKPCAPDYYYKGRDVTALAKEE